MGKAIDIIYEDRKTINLKDVINDMVDNGLAATNLEGGGVTFTANVRITAGKQED